MLQVFVGGYLSMVYDSISIRYAKDSSDINKANSIYSTIQYAGLTISPFLGGMCASYFGNVTAIIIDCLTYVFAAIIFLRIPKVFLSIEPKGDESKKETTNFAKDVISIFTVPSYTALLKPIMLVANSMAYAILNYFIPIVVFMHIGASKSHYGFAMAFIGFAYIISGRLLNTSRCSDISDRMRNYGIICSTIVNGVFLYLAMTASSMIQFSMFLFIGCFASMVSIVYLKTSLFSDELFNQKVDMPAMYKGLNGLGHTIGFVICAALGGLLSDQVLMLSMLGLLVIGPILFGIAINQGKSIYQKNNI